MTPHVLAETSNLLVYKMHGHEEAALREIFREFISDVDEQYDNAASIVQDNLFSRLGLTDVGLLHVLERNKAAGLLTTDVHLFTEAGYRGHPVVNFNHLKAARLGL